MSSASLETRDRILQATWQLLEASRGSEVRMSDIAKEAGISRQAVYLHFPTRTQLLVATTQYLDRVKLIDERLAASRAATTGIERLNAFIEAWGNYIPEIYGVAQALLAMQASDEAARAAWDDRMQAVRHGCEAAVKALNKDRMLKRGVSVARATDILWMLLSVRNWEQLVGTCGWTQDQYIDGMKAVAAATLVHARTSAKKTRDG